MNRWREFADNVTTCDVRPSPSNQVTVDAFSMIHSHERATRPPRIAIIVRGIPGSGKARKLAHRFTIFSPSLGMTHSPKQHTSTSHPYFLAHSRASPRRSATPRSPPAARPASSLSTITT